MKEVEGICLAYQRAYGFELPSCAKAVGGVRIPELSFRQLFTMIGGFMMSKDYVDANHLIRTHKSSHLLIPNYTSVHGDPTINLYDVSVCVPYPHTQIKEGDVFKLAISRDVYNREIDSAQNYRALKTFTLETEYLVWMGKSEIPLRLWLVNLGLAEKIYTPPTYFHDPVTLELE